MKEWNNERNEDERNEDERNEDERNEEKEMKKVPRDIQFLQRSSQLKQKSVFKC